MSRISPENLQIRYKAYRRRVKEIMKTEKETSSRAIAKAALEFNTSERTIITAMSATIKKHAKL